MVDPSRGVRVCLEGGYVIEDSIIDGSPEWRSFGGDEVKGLRRASGRLSYLTHDGNKPGAYIAPKGAAWRDYMATRRARRIEALRGRYRRPSGTTRSERTLIDMLQKLHELARLAGIESKMVLEQAGWIVHSYYEKRRKAGEASKKTVVINERERWAVAVVALKKSIELFNIAKAENEIYRALASLTNPKTADEIRQYSWRVLRRVNEYGIGSRIRRVPRPLPRATTTIGSTRNRISLENQRAIKRIAPYVRRLTSELGLPAYIADKSIAFVRSVVTSVPGKSLSGRKPEAIAAAAVYLMARIYDYNDITQARTAQVFNLSEANVRKALRYLLSDTVIIVGL